MERALRKAAQRLEAADGYNADSLFERLQTLSVATLNILGKATMSNNLPAAVGAIRQAREHLTFEAELLGQLKGVQNEVKLNVIYGHGARPALLDGRECPTCRQVVNLRKMQNQYNAAVKKALGLLPEDGETPARKRSGQSGTTVPAGVEPAGVETIGGFHVNREQTQVIQAEVVKQTTTTPAVPARPALPPPERESNLKVIVNQSMFSDWDKHL